MGSSSTLKIGNQNTPQSVHVSYIDCKNNTINNALSPSVGNLIIGNSQTTGALTLGSSGRTTGAINIWRPLTPKYNPAASFPSTGEIGEIIRFTPPANATFGASTATIIFTQSLPFGIWFTSATAGFQCTASGTVTSNSLYIFNNTASRLICNQRSDVSTVVPIISIIQIKTCSGVVVCTGSSNSTITLQQELIYSSGTYNTNTSNNFEWYFVRIA
jgi:hypothetical protein